MQATEAQQSIHLALHSNRKWVLIDDQRIPIEIGIEGKKYLQYQDITYEKASCNSVGRAGQLSRQGLQVTVCMQTGENWSIIFENKVEKL